MVSGRHLSPQLHGSCLVHSFAYRSLAHLKSLQWLPSQKANLVACHITQPGKPSISMITEAGIIGKIGLNDRGVGVTLNAIRAVGVRFDALPTHLALRAALEAESRKEAVEMLEAAGFRYFAVYEGRQPILLPLK